MKLLALLSFVVLSAPVFAQTCYVDLVQKPYNRVLRSFVSYGSCMEGMKECRKAIRFDYSNSPQYPNNSLDCISNNRLPPTNPNPYPNPYPTPNPNPYPSDRINLGSRVEYTPERTFGVVTRMDSYYRTMCVRFERTNIERCNLDERYLRLANNSIPSGQIQVGGRSIYTPDNTYGYITHFDYYRNTVCMRFDYPRYDGAIERCDIQAHLIRMVNR